MVLVLGGWSCWKLTPSLIFKPDQPFADESQPWIQSIKDRAAAQENVRWMPAADLYGWKDAMVYQAGKEYTGLPYGQPVDGFYVPWNLSLEEFCVQAADPNSLLYTSRSSSMASGLIEAADCSSFVSWAWNLPSRQTTWTIGQFADLISSESYANAQVGDCLNEVHSHVVLITGIERKRDGSIVSITISEASPKGWSNPDGTIHSVKYGKGSWHSLYELQLRYFQHGYELLRLKEEYRSS